MTDAQLVARVQEGDDGAFRLLVERYYPECWRYAVATLGDAPDAEDVLQDTFWSAYRAIGSYRDDGRFRYWLFSILLNKCRNANVSKSRRRHRFASLDDASTVPSSAATNPDERLDVVRALAALEPMMREAIVLKYGEDLEYREMSAITGVGESALRMRVKRGIARLRELLASPAAQETR